jgi:hypothetical protein
VAIHDSEEKIRADMEALIRRAIALGERRKTEAFRALIDDPEVPLLKDRETKEKGSKHPYGHVKNTVARVIGAHILGVGRDRIAPYALHRYQTTLDEGAIQTALKTLSKEQSIRYENLSWFPNSKLLEELKKKYGPHG